MSWYGKIVYKPQNDFCQLLCALYSTLKCSWEILDVTWHLYFRMYFSILCNVLYHSSSAARVARFHTYPSTKKKCDFFLKCEFLVPSTSRWAVPHDKEGRKILFHKVMCYKSSRKWWL